MKKGVLENFAKFTGKHLWFAKFSERSFLRNTPGRLLLVFSCNITKMGVLPTMSSIVIEVIRTVFNFIIFL